jgi:hypothetical protein
VEKFAFLTTSAMPGTVEKGAQPVPDGFITESQIGEQKRRETCRWPTSTFQLA